MARREARNGVICNSVSNTDLVQRDRSPAQCRIPGAVARRRELAEADSLSGLTNLRKAAEGRKSLLGRAGEPE